VARRVGHAFAAECSAKSLTVSEGRDNGFRCLTCDGDCARVVQANCRDYYLGKPLRVSYYRCLACGLVQQSPVPHDVSALYADYPIHTRKSFLHTLFRKLLLSSCYCDVEGRPAGTVLLDYGCGDGSYLAAQRKLGLHLIGYEPGATHARQLRETLQLPVYSDVVELLREHAGSVDVLTMHFVVEHLTDLHAGFVHAHRLLRAGGLFYFIVPQIDSLEARLFGAKWHGLDPPRHISFPGPRVVDRLAAQHGFSVSHHRAIPFANGFAGSVPALLLGRFVLPVFLLALPLGVVFSRLVPTGSRAFWLIRR